VLDRLNEAFANNAIFGTTLVLFPCKSCRVESISLGTQEVAMGARQSLIFVVLAMALTLGTVSTASANTTYVPLALRNGLTEMMLRNGWYDLGFGQFQLQDGHYEKKYEDLPPSQAIRVWFIQAALGDLNADGARDAAVILAQNGGGSGTFYYLVAVVNRNGVAQQAAAQFLGDRIVISSVVIMDGRIILDMVVQGPYDGLCCPSLREIRTFQLLGDRLQQVVSASPTPMPELGPITIVSGHCSRSDHGLWLGEDCIGEVRNDTGVPVYNIEAVVTSQNATGQPGVRGSGWSTLNMLEPGERSPFRIFVSSALEWPSYQFAVKGYSTSGFTEYAHLTVVKISDDWDNWNYCVQGTVHNDTARKWCGVGASVTLYDDSGRAIDSQWQHVDAWNLEPGTDAAFSSSFDGYDGHLAGLASYTVVAEGQECR